MVNSIRKEHVQNARNHAHDYRFQIYNSLYGIMSQSINKSYLLLTDVPESVDIDNHAFNLQYSNSFSGALHMSENSPPHVTLEHALNEV